MKWYDLKILSLAALLAAGLIGGSAPAWAEPPEGMEQPAMDEQEPPMLEALQLTQDQLNALKKDKLASRRQMIAWRAEMENLHLDLESELDSPKPNKAQIDKLARRIGELHGQMIAARAQSVLFLRSLLTPEQQKTLDSLRMNPGCMEGPGMGMGMGKPGKHGHGKHAPGQEKH
jgi:Spy/CpxP family protein refolding chaperone